MTGEIAIHYALIIMRKTVKKSPVKKALAKKSALKFKSKGISKVAILGIVAVILIVGGGVFFFTQQKSGSGMTSLPFVKAPLNPNCELKDPELCKFVNNMLVARDMTIMSNATYDETTMEYTFSTTTDNKTHMIMKQNGKDAMNIITIGDTTYTLDTSDNKWWKQTTKPDAMKETNSQVEEVKNQMKFDQDEFKNSTSYKSLGKEACGDLTCFKYELVNSEATADDDKQYIYFDDKEYLMRKLVMESKTNGSTSINYSYEKVAITEPSPIKEGEPNPFGSMPEGSMPGYSNEEVNKMMQQYQQEMPDDTSLPVEE